MSLEPPGDHRAVRPDSGVRSAAGILQTGDRRSLESVTGDDPDVPMSQTEEDKSSRAVRRRGCHTDSPYIESDASGVAYGRIRRAGGHRKAAVAFPPRASMAGNPHNATKRRRLKRVR